MIGSTTNTGNRTRGRSLVNSARVASAALLIAGAFALTVAARLSADSPTESPFEFSFDGIDRCTGLPHTVTISGTEFVHSHDGRVVRHLDKTITTSPSGYVGHGTDTFVNNGQVDMVSGTDILTNDSGDRMRARFVMVHDISTGITRV